MYNVCFVFGVIALLFLQYYPGLNANINDMYVLLYKYTIR